MNVCVNASLVAQMVKNSPTGDQGSTLDWEDALETGMGTHASIRVWESP